MLVEKSLTAVLSFAICFLVGVLLAWLPFESEPDLATKFTVEPQLIDELNGCWIGREGGFVRFEPGRIYLGSREYTIRTADIFKNEALSDYLFDTGQGGSREAGTLDRLVSVKVISPVAINLDSFEDSFDYRKANRIGDLLNLERVTCDYIQNLKPITRTDFSSPTRYEDKWQGIDGGYVSIHNGNFRFRGDHLPYDEVEHKFDTWGEKFVLKVSGKMREYDSTEQYLLIRFPRDDEMTWVRYESLDDYLRGKYTGIGDFWKENNKK